MARAATINEPPHGHVAPRCAGFCAAGVRGPFADFRFFRGPERPDNAANIGVCWWLGD